uniref:glutathione transferase n=1 Tax=Neolamprologus brichardi TaxID=32507 RepID=A0A3Q4G0U4_NEOBR
VSPDYWTFYTGDKYEEKQYVCGEAPDYDKSQWTDVKFKLGMDFPNLPYLVDGNRKITQSNAIMRYIARKHNMCGETEDEKIRVDVLENQAMDLRLAFIKLTYLNIDQKPEYLKNLQCTLKQFSDFLGGRKWFVGDKVFRGDVCITKIKLMTLQLAVNTFYCLSQDYYGSLLKPPEGNAIYQKSVNNPKFVFVNGKNVF